MIYPLVSPHGAYVDVLDPRRMETLLARGYVAEPVPLAPQPQRFQGAVITADVVLAPWDEGRVANAARYKEEIPHLSTVADETRQGCWPTVKRAWRHGVGKGTHHLVLTDDLTLAEGFWGAVEQAVSLFPESPLSLFSIKRGASIAVEAGRHWCISWGCTGAANLLPTNMIEPFLDWERDNIVPECRADDIRLTAWATAQRIGILTPVPCLVDHGHLPGVVAHSPTFGRLHSPGTTFAGDATGIDWRRGADDPVFVGISVIRPGAWLTDGRTLEEVRHG